MATSPDTIETPVAPEGQNRTRQILLLTGVIVLVVILLWFFLLRGGGEPPVESVAPPVPVESPLLEETPDRGREGRVETFEVFAPRDPFQPLVAQGDGAGEPGPAGTPAPGVTDAPGAVAGTGDSSESIGGHRVRVVDVFSNGRTAQIQVDGTVYTVDEGERFADNFELVAASGQCATMLFGDDEFTLCEGEEILK